MHLIHEDLARAHNAERLADADHQRLAAALRARNRARKAARRAEEAALRARRLFAVALVR